MKPIYNFLDDLPGLNDLPPPVLPAGIVRRTVGHHTSFDAGRGCPFQCSFCTIINVQGRKSRRRSPDDVEVLIRLNWAQGIRHFVITDDNFARNKDWEPILDRIIKLRETDKLKIKLIIQVDTLCHRLPNFIVKSARAGVTRVFIGLENINPDNLMAAKKRQNKITEYRKMLLAWKEAGVITYAGYILGFPADTPETIRADIEIIKRELPLDILEFFCLTPLPGSEDHKTLFTKGVDMDPDMNKYDLEHVVTGHERMTQEQWEGIYRAAWGAYYRRTTCSPFCAARLQRELACRGWSRSCSSSPFASRSRGCTHSREALFVYASEPTVGRGCQSSFLGILAENDFARLCNERSPFRPLAEARAHAPGDPSRSEPPRLYGPCPRTSERRRGGAAGDVHTQSGRTACGRARA